MALVRPLRPARRPTSTTHTRRRRETKGNAGDRRAGTAPGPRQPWQVEVFLELPDSRVTR